MKRKSRNKVPEETERNRYENLRGQNQRLRKEVQRLRKENAKLRGREEELSDLVREEDLSENITEIQKTLNCPTCGSSNINIIPKLKGNVDYFFCQNSSCMDKGPMK